MKLVSFGEAGRERPGLFHDQYILDLGAADPKLPQTVRDLLAHELLDGLRDRFGAVDSWPKSATLRRDNLRLGPPITNPSKIICLGLNYRDHAAEQGKTVPAKPLLFSKGPNVLCGHGDAVGYPTEADQIDHEVELAFVVGKRATRVAMKDAWPYVAGYGVFMDLSARDLQYTEKQWFRAKSIDGFGPFGPYLVTADEVGNPHDLNIAIDVNGVTRQASNTGQMAFTVPFLIHHLSQTMTLEPGDIVATGTPGGVGVFEDPPRFLQRGDTLTARIDKLGTLQVTLR